ncbi:hypothetical protein ABZ353_10625 [Streptomyces niveus]|uniref:hypothetical protein n=1 Tax=Streptomyces niveus TaxID=193462 RepID=UPI0033C65110
MSVTLEKMYQVSHADGTADKRYTVRLEWCGHETQLYVARFCGHWISCAETQEGAWKDCTDYRDKPAG